MPLLLSVAIPSMMIDFLLLFRKRRITRVLTHVFNQLPLIKN